MIPPFNYLDLLLLAGSSLLVLFFLVFLRRREISHASPLEQAISTTRGEIPQEILDQLLPLLVLEERFPAFGKIVALVLSRRGIEEITQRESFIEPASYLAQATFSEKIKTPLRGALCHMVRGFLDDPDVEYSCRPELADLVDEFIDEVHRDESAVSSSA